MNAKQTNTMLWTAAVAVGVCAIGGLIYGFVWPLDRGNISTAVAGKLAVNPTTTSTLPPLAAFEKIWNTPLRQALGDPAPALPVTPVAVTPISNPATVDPSGVPVSLIGTIGESLALFKTVTNVVEVCAVGDSFNGVTVIAVRPSEVDVRFNGQIVKLSKPAEK